MSTALSWSGAKDSALALWRACARRSLRRRSTAWPPSRSPTCARTARRGWRRPGWPRGSRSGRRTPPRFAREFVAGGFRALIVSVDGDQLGHEFLGRELDAPLLDALPPGVDPCGERGEFHTFVHEGPVFAAPLPVRTGARRADGRFAWLELGPP